MAKFTVYSPGKSGVNIDNDPLLLADDEVQLGQNAYHDPTAAHGGAIRKRPGLIKFSQNLTGVVLGGITLPVPGTGGAPAVTGSSPIGTPSPTGDSTGTGAGTGAPGGTFSGGSASFGSAGAGAFTATTQFGGARILAIGREASADANRGWYLTSRGFADVPISSLIPTAPNQPEAPVWNSKTGATGPVFALGVEQLWTYYPKFVPGGSSPEPDIAIYRTNGGSAQQIATIPGESASGSENGAIYLSTGTDNYIYISTYHRVGGGGNTYSKLIRMNPSTFATSELTNTKTGTNLYIYPTFSAFGNISGSSRVFYGTATRTSDGLPKIYVSNADVTSFTADATWAGGLTGYDDIRCFCQFNGKLWAGFSVQGASPSPNLLAYRSATAATSDVGAWTFRSDLSGIITNGIFVVNMIVWRDGNLYVSIYKTSTNGSFIYQVVPSGGDYVFNQVLSVTSEMPYFLWADPADPNYGTGKLYAIGSQGSGVNPGKYRTSADGTSWGAASSFSAFSNGSAAIPCFVGMNQ